MRRARPFAGRTGSAARAAATAALALSLAAGLVPGTAAARPIDKVRQSGVLVVSVYRDFAPWVVEEDGKAKGIDVEIGELLAAELGVKAEIMVRMAGEDVDGDLRANVWRGDIVERKVADVMMHVPVDPELARRNDNVVICCRYAQERMAIAFDPATITTRSFAVFRSRKVAVELDSTADIWLSAAFNGILGANIERGRTFDVAAERFRAGAVPALVATRAQVDWAVRGLDRPVAVEEWPMPGIVRSSWPIGLAVKVGSHDLGHALDAAIEKAAADGRLAAIHAKWGTTRLAPTE